VRGIAAEKGGSLEGEKGKKQGTPSGGVRITKTPSKGKSSLGGLSWGLKKVLSWKEKGTREVFLWEARPPSDGRGAFKESGLCEGGQIPSAIARKGGKLCSTWAQGGKEEGGKSLPSLSSRGKAWSGERGNLLGEKIIPPKMRSRLLFNRKEKDGGEKKKVLFHRWES